MREGLVPGPQRIPKSGDTQVLYSHFGGCGNPGYHGGPTACEMQAFPWVWAIFNKMGWRGKARGHMDHSGARQTPPTPQWPGQNGKQQSLLTDPRPPHPRDRKSRKSSKSGAPSCWETRRGGRGLCQRGRSLTEEPSAEPGATCSSFPSPGLPQNAASSYRSHVQQSTSTYSNLKHRNKGLQNGILISVRTKATSSE